MGIKVALFLTAFLCGLTSQSEAQNVLMELGGLCASIRNAKVWGIKGYKGFPTNLSTLDTTQFNPTSLDTLFWPAETDAASKTRLQSPRRLLKGNSVEDWSRPGAVPSNTSFNVLFVMGVSGVDTTWVMTPDRIVVPGMKYKNTSIPAQPAAPSHFSPKVGWTWVYEYHSSGKNFALEGSDQMKIWLTLKTYSETGTQFTSSWAVSLTASSFVDPAGPIAPVTSESNIRDSVITVEGHIDSGMQLNDFLPSNLKKGGPLPPLFLSHCKLPAILSEKAVSSNSFGPPYHVYWQFAAPWILASVYKDSVGLLTLTLQVAPDVNTSTHLQLTYFGLTPPEKPVAIAPKARKRYSNTVQGGTRTGRGISRFMFEKTVQTNAVNHDGLGRALR